VTSVGLFVKNHSTGATGTVGTVGTAEDQTGKEMIDHLADHHRLANINLQNINIWNTSPRDVMMIMMIDVGMIAGMITEVVVAAVAITMIITVAVTTVIEAHEMIIVTVAMTVVVMIIVTQETTRVNIHAK
jgi:hypothetical protein